MNKITTFDNFKIVSNKKMKAVISQLDEMGVHYESAEDPTMDEDGFIELTEKTHLSVSRSGHIKCGVELANGEFKFGKKTENIQEALDELMSLKLSENIDESDYTTDFTSTKPMKMNPTLLQKRSERCEEAVKLINNAIAQLKLIPKLDWMQDIPEIIEKLEDVLGNDESGLVNLSNIYKNKI
jgi:hypothetical protein